MNFLKSTAFFNNAVSAFMVLVICGLSFYLGSTWTRLKIYENGGSIPTAKTANNDAQAPAQNGAVAVTKDDLPTIVKNIGVDQAAFQKCLDSKEMAAKVKLDLDGGVAAGVQGTPATFVYSKKANKAVLIGGAYPYAEVKKNIDEMIAGTSTTATVITGLKKPTADDKLTGNKNADIVLISYSDFECPFCKRFNPTLQQALGEYKDKIALVHRQFPLSSIHPNADAFAEGSECVYKLGGNDKFWAFADKLYTDSLQ